MILTSNKSRRRRVCLAAAIAATLTSGCAFAQEAAKPATVAAPAPADTDRALQKQVVHRFLMAWQTNDRAAFAKAIDADIEFAYPGGRIGRDELLALFDSYHREKTDIRIYLWDQFFSAGDQFATAYQFAATDRKTGKRQAVGTGVAGRLRGGKIVLFKEYYDEDVANLQYQDKLPLDEGGVSPWPSSVWLRPDRIN